MKTPGDELKVAHLFTYPVKSAAGVWAGQVYIGPRGIFHDREWVVVDENGMFVAQRSSRGLGIGIKILCLVKPLLRGDILMLRAPGMQDLSIPLLGPYGLSVPVQVWDDHLTGSDEGDEAAQWLTQFLSKERPGNYRLVI